MAGYICLPLVSNYVICTVALDIFLDCVLYLAFHSSVHTMRGVYLDSQCRGVFIDTAKHALFQPKMKWK